MVEYVLAHYPGEKIALIGTKRTVESQAYEKKIRKSDPSIKLKSVAAPLLVPMIEEGFFNNKISHDIIDEYLSNPAFRNIQALILGCTHYPLIKKQIDEYFKSKVAILDSSEIVAIHLKNELTRHGLAGKQKKGEDHFLVSDYTKSFELSAALFFHEKIKLELYKLWE